VAGSLTDVGRRLDALDQHVSVEVAKLGESIHAEHLAVTTLSQELEPLPAVGQTPSPAGRGLSGRRGRRSDQVDRRQLEALATAVDRVQAGAVVPDDLNVLRSRLEAEFARRLAAVEAEARRMTSLVDDTTSGAVEQLAERLDEMAGWILAEAKRVSQGGGARAEDSGRAPRRTAPPAASSGRSTSKGGRTAAATQKPAAVDPGSRRRRMVLAARPPDPPANGHRPPS
jgi:hypothetical protein